MDNAINSVQAAPPNLSYDEAKEKVIKIQKMINESKLKIKNLINQGKALEQEAVDIRRRFEHNTSLEASKQLDTYSNQISEPFAQKVTSLEEQLLNLEEQYTKDLSDFSEDNVSNYYYNETEMLEEIQEALEMLNQQLTDLLGKRFQTEVEAQLNSVTLDIPEEKLESICNYFDELTEYFEQVKEKNNKFISVEKIVKRVNSYNTIFETGNKKIITIALLVLCIIFYFAFKYLFPVYIIILFLYAGYNIKLSHKIHTTCVLRKIILDNLNKIENMYRERALDQLQEDRDKLTTEYLSNKEKLEEELTSAKNKLESILMSAKDRFSYNDSKLRNELDDLLLVNKNKRKDVERFQIKEQAHCEDLMKEYMKAKEDFNQVANGIKDTYIGSNRIGDSYIITPEFLFDIEKNTKKPKFFKFTFGSSLFVYNDIQDVIDFIRLIIVQLRARLTPSCLNVTVYDDRFIGQHYLGFKDENNDNVMKIIINKDNLKDYIESVSEVSILRTGIVKRGFSDILQYNKFMLEQDSLPESYNFLFLQDPDYNLMLETKFKQLLLNGGDLGIYPFVFLDSTTFYEGKERSRELLSGFKTIYTFEPDAQHQYEGSSIIVKTKSKEFVNEKMIKEK